MFRSAVALLALASCVTAPDRPAQIEHQRWTIDAYSDGGQIIRSEDVFRTAGTIMFANGELTGSPGCGMFVGEYSLNAPRIHIDAGVVIAGTCLVPDAPFDLAPASARVCEALSRASSIGRRGNELILRDRRGAVQVVLVTATPKKFRNP